MSIGSASIRRASGAMNKTDKKTEKPAFSATSVLADVELDKISAEEVQASEELVKSVKKYGVLQPVVLLDDGGKLKLVSGNARVAAARSAGMQQIKAVVITLEGTGASVARKDLFKRSKKAAAELVEEEITVSSIHEEKFNAIRSVGSDLPDYLL